MGVCFSLLRDKENEKTIPPTSMELDFPVPVRTFEVGGPSEPPDDQVVSVFNAPMQQREDVGADSELSRYA